MLERVIWKIHLCLIRPQILYMLLNSFYIWQVLRVSGSVPT